MARICTESANPVQQQGLPFPLATRLRHAMAPGSASADWSEIHPDRLTSNRIEAQSELNRIEWGNHEKGKEARQIQDFIETTS